MEFIIEHYRTIDVNISEGSNIKAYPMAIDYDVTSIIYMDIILSNNDISPIFSDIRFQYFETNQQYTLHFYYHYGQYLILIICQLKCKYLINRNQIFLE